MYCPTCQMILAASDALTAETWCPVCGAAMRAQTTADAVGTTGNAVMRMEGVPEQHWICGYVPADYDPKPPMAVILRRQKEDAVAMFKRAAALPALAWRQPAVRAAVKAGAGAVALSLAARAARTWLAQPRRGRATGQRLLPSLADALGSPNSRAGVRRERGPDEATVVIETFIYARHVIRR